MSRRNSCSSRGVPVASGVIQCGCSSWVRLTIASQDAMNPSDGDTASSAQHGATTQVIKPARVARIILRSGATHFSPCFVIAVWVLRVIACVKERLSDVRHGTNGMTVLGQNRSFLTTKGNVRVSRRAQPVDPTMLPHSLCEGGPCPPMRRRNGSDAAPHPGRRPDLPRKNGGGKVGALAGGGREPLEDKFLHPVALRFTGHDVALRIDVQAVQMEELACLAPWPADVADLFKRCAIQDRDAFVR